jgi:hypothetical protein
LVDVFANNWRNITDIKSSNTLGPSKLAGRANRTTVYNPELNLRKVITETPLDSLEKSTPESPGYEDALASHRFLEREADKVAQQLSKLDQTEHDQNPAIGRVTLTKAPLNGMNWSGNYSNGSFSARIEDPAEGSPNGPQYWAQETGSSGKKSILAYDDPGSQERASSAILSTLGADSAVEKAIHQPSPYWLNWEA